MAENKPGFYENPTQGINIQAQTPVNSSRRRLTGAGLGVSAIFTLASRPVLAAQCMSPSAAASGNLSQHGTPPVCSGLTPGYWKQHTEDWPSPYLPGSCTSSNSCNSPQEWSDDGTKFHPLFNGSNFLVIQAGNSKSLTLQQVMVMNDGKKTSSTLNVKDRDNLGAHIVAALLNAASGKTKDILSEIEVISMWNEWVSKGYFEPTAGATWNSAQIVTYLKTTMD